MDKTKLIPEMKRHFKLFNEILVGESLPEIDIEAFRILLHSYIDCISDLSFTHGHLLMFYKMSESKRIEHFVHMNTMSDFSKIDKELLISKREAYLKCEDHNKYHLRILTNMIEWHYKIKSDDNN
jgi:hypothetical protein